MVECHIVLSEQCLEGLSENLSLSLYLNIIYVRRLLFLVKERK